MVGAMSALPKPRPMPMPMPMTTIARRALVVDDHPVVADALSMAISSMRVFDHVDMAASLAEARKLLEENAEYALAILDLHLGDADGRVTLMGLRESYPDVPILVFTGDSSLENI